ncbi:MAG: DUF2510 domain-containing protein [Acidimicrobiales bacterium]|nr:DUF2510 domain-containing protein [Acidimicrobiales bacterium]
MSTPDAGWYPDPLQPGRLRWWDGSAWTEHFAPGVPEIPSAQIRSTSGSASGGGLRDLGDMLGDAFQVTARRAGHLLPLVLLGSLLPAFLWGLITFPVFEDLWFSNGEWSNLTEGDLIRLGVGAVLTLLTTGWLWLATTHQMVHSFDGDGPAWATSASEALRQLPRLLLWGLVALVPVVLAVGLTVVLFNVGSPGWATLVILASVVTFAVYGVQLCFFLPAVVTAPGENPISRSVSMVSGRFGPILGRMAMLVFVGFACSISMNLLVNPFAALLGATIDFGEAASFDSDGRLRSFRGDLLVSNAGLLATASTLSAIPGALASVLGLAGLTSVFRSLSPGDG